MTALVVHHVALRTEPLAAHLAFKRVIIVVNAHVNCQVLLFRETFATVRVCAAIGLGAEVHVHVRDEPHLPEEHLIAPRIAALELFITHLLK